MAELKAQETTGTLATLPTAKEVMEQIALKKQRKLPLPRASFRLRRRRKRHRSKNFQGRQVCPMRSAWRARQQSSNAPQTTD
jgi:hypothetical protein